MGVLRHVTDDDMLVHQSKPVFMIGAHKLEGEIIKLRQPMLIMRKSVREGEVSERAQQDGGGESY